MTKEEREQILLDFAKSKGHVSINPYGNDINGEAFEECYVGWTEFMLKCSPKAKVVSPMIIKINEEGRPIILSRPAECLLHLHYKLAKGIIIEDNDEFEKELIQAIAEEGEEDKYE